MYYHAIAILPGDRRKSLVNRSYDEMLAKVVSRISIMGPFVHSGVQRRNRTKS